MNQNQKPSHSKSPIQFCPFDENGPVRFYYHGILPHWRQEGCTYFVTFRLADSIPKAILEQIEHERTIWLKARDINPSCHDWKQTFARLPAQERRQYEKLVGRLLNHSLDDCHGSCILCETGIGNLVATALDYFHESRVLTGDFVIMPNHVHALLTPLPGFELEDILQSIKSFTANKVNRSIGRKGELWQKESYDHIVRDGEQLVAFQSYIAGNPEKAKLGTSDYILSRAEYIVGRS